MDLFYYTLYAKKCQYIGHKVSEGFSFRFRSWFSFTDVTFLRNIASMGKHPSKNTRSYSGKIFTYIKQICKTKSLCTKFLFLIFYSDIAPLSDRLTHAFYDSFHHISLSESPAPHPSCAYWTHTAKYPYRYGSSGMPMLRHPV